MTVSQKNSMKLFWDHIKVPLLLSFKMAFLERSTSLKQVVIKLIEKKNRNKRFTKNWRPIFSRNLIDLKSTIKPNQKLIAEFDFK